MPLIAILTTVTRSHGAILLDLSATGARLRGHDLPRLGDDLLLTIEGVRAFGTIVWSEAPECGVAFAEAVHPADLQLVRERAGELPGLPPDPPVPVAIAV